MSDKEKDLVARLLKQSILTVCRETVAYGQQLEIDGIVCISSGDDSKQIVIKVHELFQKPNTNSKKPTHEIANFPFFGGEESASNLNNGWLNEEERLSDRHGANEKNVPEVIPNGVSMERVGRDNSDQADQIPVHNVVENGVYTPDAWSDASESRVTMSSPSDTDVSSMAESTMDDDSSVAASSFSSVITKPINRIFDQKAVSKKPPKKTADFSAKTFEGEDEPNEDMEGAREDTSMGIETQARSSSPGYIVRSEVPLPVNRDLRDIECKRCHKVLEDGAAFENHNLSSHNVFTCLVCYNTFTCRNNMKRHMRLHTGYRPYQCTHCSESFTRKDDIKRHLIRHNYSKPFRCNLCNKGYMDRKSIKTHLRKDHCKSVVHCCPTCGETFDNMAKFQEHRKSHPELMVFHCSLCPFTGANPLMFDKHMLTHGREKSFQCSKCHIDFSDPFKYTAHLKKHRFDANFNCYRCCFCSFTLETYDQFVRHEHTHVQCKRHTCTVCKKQFRYPSNLREHMLIHSDMSKQIKVKLNKSKEVLPGRVAPVLAVKEEVADDFEKSHDSVHSMAEEDFQMYEPQLNESSSQYWCTECNQGFGSENHLTEHIAMAHDEDGSENSKTSPEAADLHGSDNADDSAVGKTVVQNVRKSEEVNEDVIPFDEGYEHENNMDDHTDGYAHMNGDVKKIDSGLGNDSDLENEIADASKDYDGNRKLKNTQHRQNKRKSSPSILSANVLDADVSNIPVFPQNETECRPASNHMPPPGVATTTRSPGFERVVTPDVLFRTKVPFQCDLCKGIFDDFDVFDRHCNNVHRRFICDFCGKQFTSKPNRDRHVRYHTGEKPYKCELCNLSFFRGDDLKYHRTTRHSDVKPFSCSKCRMNFAWAKDLEKHLKCHK